LQGNKATAIRLHKARHCDFLSFDFDADQPVEHGNVTTKGGNSYARTALNSIILATGIHSRNVIDYLSEFFVHIQHLDKTIRVLCISTEWILSFYLRNYLGIDSGLCPQDIDAHEDLAFKLVLPHHVWRQQVLQF